MDAARPPAGGGGSGRAGSTRRGRGRRGPGRAHRQRQVARRGEAGAPRATESEDLAGDTPGPTAGPGRRGAKGGPRKGARGLAGVGGGRRPRGNPLARRRPSPQRRREPGADVPCPYLACRRSPAHLDRGPPGLPHRTAEARLDFIAGSRPRPARERGQEAPPGRADWLAWPHVIATPWSRGRGRTHAQWARSPPFAPRARSRGCRGWTGHRDGWPRPGLPFKRRSGLGLGLPCHESTWVPGAARPAARLRSADPEPLGC